ncbi:hypothetical protein EIN_425350 [Entamoeba invadens IP1]|uniref:Uncharacterized protein n=1 Tax=Entamoeba invadens IP1 TaxID=370355 RepID=A0A0A1U5Z5_ENTIV|nr:hypothetical protein EIN_425350 [Entamoeba invadens IP1]ELP89803.1 hypothetical protein EIN_425350 [Entamoeba invadens IP1]|eukprot:XP_004256574.1 hypothetical protein EIN_425350 [Entamoeba invadens IP1]
MTEIPKECFLSVTLRNVLGLLGDMPLRVSVSPMSTTTRVYISTQNQIPIEAFAKIKQVNILSNHLFVLDFVKTSPNSVKKIREFFEKSLLFNNSLYYEQSESHKETKEFFFPSNNSVSFEYNNCRVILGYAKSLCTLKCAMFVNNWYVPMEIDTLRFFPFVNYHMYFEKRKLLSDFTTNKIRSVVILLKTGLNIVQPSELLCETNPIFEELRNTLYFNLSLAFQKFMTQEIASNSKTPESQMELFYCQKIGECVEGMFEPSSATSTLLNTISLTPHLIKPQVSQNAALSAMSKRIQTDYLFSDTILIE